MGVEPMDLKEYKKVQKGATIKQSRH